MKDGGMNGCMMSCKNLFNEDCTYACFTDPIVDTRSDSTFGCMVPCNMLDKMEAACAWMRQKPHDAADYVLSRQ